MTSENFVLDDFLDNYVPKNPDYIFKHYLKNKKLKDYQVMTPEKYPGLIIGKTYIKYIDKQYSRNLKIHHGGILVSGGFYEKTTYHTCNDFNQWTHLMLKSSIIDTSDDLLTKTTDYIFIVSLDKHYFFYKLFKEIIRERMFRETIVQLIKK